MTPQEKIIWTENAKPREQIIMLRIIGVFGKKFSATHQEIAEKIGVNQTLLASIIPGLKELGWLENERVYSSGEQRGVAYCNYKITV